jgi:hypothetical protein
MPFAGASLIAQQDAMMRRMIRDIDSVMAMVTRGPRQIIRSATGAMAAFAPRMNVVVTSVSIGGRTCSQTVSYEYSGNGRRPHVAVSRTGDGCGTMRSPSPPEVVRALPEPPHASPAPRARLWTVGYPLRPKPAGVPPRT